MCAKRYQEYGEAPGYVPLREGRLLEDFCSERRDVAHELRQALPRLLEGFEIFLGEGDLCHGIWVRLARVKRGEGRGRKDVGVRVPQ
jgi:hypothetical protein